MEQENRGQRIIDMFVEPMTLEECEKRVEYRVEEGYVRVPSKKMCGALACVFDLTADLVADAANLRKISNFLFSGWEVIPNYCQCLSMLPMNNNNSVCELLHHLVKEKVNSPLTKLQLQCLQTIESKYQTADKYFECVSERLWQEKDYLSKYYDDQLVLLRKRLLELKYM